MKIFHIFIRISYIYLVGKEGGDDGYVVYLVGKEDGDDGDVIYVVDKDWRGRQQK
jgi:hypothetical protein